MKSCEQGQMYVSSYEKKKNYKCIEINVYASRVQKGASPPLWYSFTVEVNPARWKLIDLML